MQRVGHVCGPADHRAFSGRGVGLFRPVSLFLLTPLGGLVEACRFHHFYGIFLHCASCAQVSRFALFYQLKLGAEESTPSGTYLLGDATESSKFLFPLA